MSSYRKVAGVCFALVVLTSAAEAKPRHWYKDPAWWAGKALIDLSVGIDAQSTCRGFVRGGVEGNFLARGNRSCGTEIGLAIGADVAYTGLHWLEWKVGHNDPNRAIRVLSDWTVPAAVGAVHLSAAAKNYSRFPSEPAK